MTTAPAPSSLSPSERRTLQLIAEGELQGGLDWVAVQRLKATGLVEERPKGLVLTADGRRALSRVLSRS
jgi:ribosomal protein S19E (S16A)